jgi:hypothetical protein
LLYGKYETCSLGWCASYEQSTPIRGGGRPPKEAARVAHRGYDLLVRGPLKPHLLQPFRGGAAATCGIDNEVSGKYLAFTKLNSPDAARVIVLKGLDDRLFTEGNVGACL